MRRFTVLVFLVLSMLGYFNVNAEAANGSVVVVDGVDFLATATGNVLGDSATGYVYAALAPGQLQNITDSIGQVKTYYWTNDAWDTGYAVKNLVDMLKAEYAAAKATNSPLVIVSHSWGTVLAYVALEQNPDIVVDKLITMGSPLSVDTPIPGLRNLIGSFTSLKLSLQGINSIKTLPNVRSWSNYWTDCDLVSASIPPVGQGNIDVQATSLNPLTCHSSYYKDPATWFEILTNVLNTPAPLKVTATPSVPSALTTASFTATGSLINPNNTTYAWNFGEPASGSANTSTAANPSYYYYDYGSHTVTLDITDTATSKTYQSTKEVTVKPYPIDVAYNDNNYESRILTFSAPSSDLVDTYTWNFADGSPTVTDRTPPPHEYATPGYYTVQLTLLLKDGTSIQSERGVFGGTGTRYIQGHTIYGDETWYSGGTYEVQGSITVAQGATLTIEQGVTVKVATGYLHQPSFTVNGTLQATGATFTKGGDYPGAWGNIAFLGAGSSASKLENCVIELSSGANKDLYYDRYPGAISINDSSPTISGCTLSGTNFSYQGISVQNGSPVISGNTVSGMTGGVVVNNASPTVTGNTFSGNQYGIQVNSDSGGMYQGNTLNGNTTYGMFYSGNTILTATNNNWGDPSGPLDNSDDRTTGGFYNPNGKGNKVSNNVIYYPWTGIANTQTAAPSGLSATPGNATANLKWNSNDSQDLGGYKVYYGTTSGSYSTPVIVGNISSYKLTGLTNGITYYLAISAMNSIGVESAKSSEITVKPVYDVTAPTITTFTATASPGLLTVVISLTATDNIGGTGVADYCIQETNSYTGCTWNSTIPTQYTFATTGNKILYAWARDGAENVSPTASAVTTITLADTIAPVITAFTMPTTANSLTVPVSTLTATDDVAVTGYLLTETASQPQADNSTWTASILLSYTFATQGVKTLYAFAKDATGNISVPLSASVTITLADTTAPTVTAFTMPATANSLTVPVSTLTATDDAAVTGYLLTETASQPQADNPAWTVPVPVSHTFSTKDVKTLYLFTKDAAGNISVPLSASVTITLPDTTAPTVTAFTLPATASDLIVPVSSLAATDAVGVTGYLLSETASQPQANDPVWSATIPTSYTFTTQGTKTLYAFAKDAAGNVSAPLSASVTISLPDTTAPTVTAFTIPATSTSLTVPVSSFTATDAVGVTGYLLNEIATIPSLTDIHWTMTPTSSYTFANAGAKTLYAWAKDASGNVSAAVLAAVNITLPDTTAPTVNLFTLPTTATSLTIAVTALTATDDVAVTGYLLSESATPPQPDNPAWTSTPPTSYTLAAQGVRTVYAFAKDAAGNISAPLSATVTITLPDTTAPTVTAFAIQATSASLTVPVTVFSATDNKAVTGYFLSESTTTPPAADPGWTSTPPVVHTFSTVGSKTLYAFAKDAAGNISPPANASVTITLPAINGACGSSDGQTQGTAPTTNFCTAGTASSVTGSGPWSWTCSGLNGGTNATCAVIILKSGVLVPSSGKTEPDISDALRILNIAVGKIIPTAADYAQGDVAPLDSSGKPKGNGVIDTYDVIGILRMIVGLL